MARSTSNTINYSDAIKSLKSGNVAPVYFIFGEEKFLHDDLIEKIVKISVDAAVQDFNLDRFYANEVEVEKVINAAKSYPMMAERRTIIVKDIDKFKQADLNKIANYVSKPSQTSCLVLTLAQKLKSGKTIKIISDNSIAIDCRQLYDNEIIPWIQNYLQKQGIEIDVQALYLLQAQVGNSLLNLTKELDKVMINIHPKTKITEQDIQQISSLSKQYNIFELCNSIGNKNLKAAIKIFNKLLEQGENPTSMVIQILRHMVNIFKISECLRAGKTSSGDLVKITGLAPFFIGNIKTQAKNFTSEQLRNAFKYLAEADLHLKTGYQKPYLVMELLIYKLIKGNTI